MQLQEIRIKGVSEGLDRVKADLLGVNAAHRDSVAAAGAVNAESAKLNRAMLSNASAAQRMAERYVVGAKEARVLATELERLDRLVASGNLSRGQADTFGAQAQMNAQVAMVQAQNRARLQAANANDLINPDAGKKVGLAAHEVQNLTFQLNDAGTMLLSGASPFQIMATQGGQVLQVLQGSQGGVKGAISELGQGLLGLSRFINPVTIGLTAAAGAALYLGTRSRTGMEDATKALAGYNGLLGDLRVGFASAADAADVFFKANQVESGTVTLASIKAQQAVTKASLTSQIEGVGNLDVIGLKTGSIEAAYEATRMLSSGFREGQSALRELYSELTRGDITVDRFREGVANIRLNPEMPQTIKDAADAIITATRDTRTLELQMGALEEAAGKAAGKMGRLRIPAFQDRPANGPQERNLGARMDPDGLADIREKLLDQREEILDPKKSPHDEYLKASRERMQSVADEVAALERQRDGIGKTAGAIAGMEFETTRLADARRAAAEAGEILSPSEEANIRASARAIASLTDEIKAQTEARRLFTSQQEIVDSLKAEASALGKSDDYRRQVMSQLKAENDLKRAGIDLNSEFAKSYEATTCANSDYAERQRQIEQAFEAA